VPRGYTRVLGKIAEITDNGIPVHFFTGNHDIWVFDYLPSETGVIVHCQPLETVLMGKKFFLAHGDGLDESDKGYRFLKKIFTNRVVQRLYSWIHPNCTITFANRWSKRSRSKREHKPDIFQNEKDGMYRFAATTLGEKYFDYFVFGHRHHMSDLPIGEKSRFILLGDWISHFSYGVFDGENFELKKYKLKSTEQI
ncbi:MAG: UDP-2,3-diacylglucosamine diphosphatase, partial [Prolixibacteraceae bacterium]|nr:UDP-2,3-diacylglucosamine diphosphatase [Prolixibacteraceae bacterium]